ncbi:MAG: rRNA pseudouridine synthase [Spirochaetaceae bacterium]|jgi:23S rRNA pseudouridine2605 synthase|nr:rRNA pseudouridine synthase [Spirochaetaceae bacterium]
MPLATSIQPLRLQVYLAHSGIASRRESEKLILAGRVTVNGNPVTELGTKVIASDAVSVDGTRVTIEQQMHYIAMHKPQFYLCTQRDPYNRPLARSLLPVHITERLYSIGRLDFRSSGLILWTNDGNFAAALAHPSSEIEKEYLVEATSFVPNEMIDGFTNGITIDNEYYQCRTIEKIGRKGVRIVLIEGKNREIRRVFSHFHLHPVVLRRIRIGAVWLDDLAEGKTRLLTEAERHSFFQ